jgi:type IV pilus assembly protein PilA
VGEDAEDVMQKSDATGRPSLTDGLKFPLFGLEALYWCYLSLLLTKPMSPAKARAHVSFQTRLLLHLSKRKTGLSAAQQGFTLVELMIVVAIVGILSAVALPNFLGARSAAKISSRVAEAISFSKECAVLLQTDIGTAYSASTQRSGSGTADGVSEICDNAATTDAVIKATWGAGVKALGVKCLTVSSASGSTLATITVKRDPGTSGDSITCAFS